MKASKLWFSLVLTALVISLSLPISAQEQGLTPELVVDLEHVADVALSPDGKHIAYVLSVPRSPDDEPGHSYAELFVVPTDGGSPKQYVHKPDGVSDIAWSPNGNSLTFLADRNSDKRKQIYRIFVDGGEAVTLTDHISSITAHHWSPDGKSIAFIASDPKTEEEKQAEKKGRDWQVYNEDYKHRRLWRLDVASGESKQLYDDNLTAWEFVWTSDSKNLIFQGTDKALTDDSYMFKKIYLLPAAGGDPKVICQTEGKLGAMAVSPDSKRLAFLGAVSLNDPIAQSLFVVSLPTGTPKNLTEGMEASGSWTDWLDNQKLVLLSTRKQHTVLSEIDTNSGIMKDVNTPDEILYRMEIHPKSGTFAAVVSTPTHPTEVYAGKLGTTKLKRLTQHNPELNKITFARQEEIEWQGADDWTIEGVITYPLGYEEGKRYPLVLQIHGGPEGVSRDGWTTYPTYPVQVLAANGYFVLQPNYRGSAGRGVAFSKADHDDLGGKEFQDVLAGIDALVESGMVDGNRIGTGGWSYGGYFSAWAATRHSERFKASVVSAGLSNWISFTGTTDIPHEMSLVHWNSYWISERDLHWKRSPVYHIQNAQTATLVVHGLKDDRVHPEQSMELYTSLKLKGVPTQLVLYPREPHGLTERAHELDFMQRMLNWYEKYIQTTGTN